MNTFFNPYASPFGVHSTGTAVNDLAGALGINAARLGALIDTMSGNDLGALANMYDMQASRMIGRATTPYERALLTANGTMPPAPFAAYSAMAGQNGFGFGYPANFAPFAFGSNAFFDMALGGDPYQAMMMRSMMMNPAMMAQAQQMLGGAFGFGPYNNLMLQRFGGAFGPLGIQGINPMAVSAMNYLGGMHRFAPMGMLPPGFPPFGPRGFFGSPFYGMAMNGFQNMMGHQGVAGPGWGPWDNSGPMGGRGFGSWNPAAMPGRLNNTNPYYETSHQMEIDGILADPSLSVQDKVMIMLMAIMNKMDRDILRQGQYINSLQNQQGKKGPNRPLPPSPYSMGPRGMNAAGMPWGRYGMQGPFGPPYAPGGVQSATHAQGKDVPSVDIETKKLEQMMTKRNQMFQMLQGIMESYKQTVDRVLQSMR